MQEVMGSNEVKSGLVRGFLVWLLFVCGGVWLLSVCGGCLIDVLLACRCGVIRCWCL